MTLAEPSVTHNNMEPIDEITIFMSNQEAIQFRMFQQYYEQFVLMVSKGVFDIRDGSVEVHFDHFGAIQKIDRHDPLFDARHI